jgi:NAD(P)-dependent dehydrogenase (short-subunit alcohol dehydrogenase family)
VAELGGRLAVVTGGGGAIGAVATAALVGLGADVVVCGRDRGRLARTAAAHPGRVIPYALDVSDEGSWARFAADLGGLHREAPTVLVTAAGVNRRAPLLGSRVDDWEEMWRTNVLGTMLAARALVPAMLEQGFGRVIAVSSVGGRVGLDGRSGYAATKGAVEAFVRSLASELGASGITVNCLAPGAIETELNRDWFAANPGVRAGIEERLPQRRLGAPEELAEAFRFLSTSSYSQGSVIAVDGGWSAA